MKKQRLTLLLVLALVISLLTIGVSAGNGDAIDLSQATNLTFTESCTLTGESGGQVVLDGTATPITVTLQGATIQGERMKSGIQVSGDVTLVLKQENMVTGGDGSRTGCAGVEVTANAELTISGSGSLTALGGSGKQTVSGSQNYTKWARGGDGIGENGQESNKRTGNGKITIESGTVIAKGMASGSGIGCQSIEIRGGTVTARAIREDRMGEGEGQYAQQDGGGYGIGSKTTDSIVITGGKIDAEGEAQGAGVGASGTISISGNADVNAVGGTQGAGVGNGTNNAGSPEITITGNADVTASCKGSNAPGVGIVGIKNDCTIEISGSAVVNATGGTCFPGVGGNSSNDYVLDIQVLEAASVEAKGGDGENYGFGPGAGIGSGTTNVVMAQDRNCITIDTSGTVTAVGGDETHGEAPGAAAGIGGAAECSGGTIKILRGTVTATGGNSTWGGGAGIGGGSLGTSGDITISGGNITATGGDYAAAIGSGYNADVKQITISGGKITATAGQYGTGIGSGQRGAVGTIIISGGDISAYGVYGNAIGAGHQGGTGTIRFTGGSTYAVSSNQFGVSAIGGGRRGAACTVEVMEGATVYAFSAGLGNANYEELPAIYNVADTSTASLVQGAFHLDHPIQKSTLLKLGNQEILSPDSYSYRGFAFTVPSEGSYTLTKTADGKELAATSGSGSDATTQLQTGTVYANLYWSEVDDGGEPINPQEPDPVVPDESWMDDYTGSATYDPVTDTTTVTGSLTDGKFLYVIPEDAKGTVVLDGTDYIDALISQYVNTYEELWYPGSISRELPIVVKNDSDFAYSYADAAFGVDDAAEAAERYHIANTLGRLGSTNDKDILRTACQPIQALYGKSSDALSTKEVLQAMDQVEKKYPGKFKTFGDYALWYYQQNYEDAKDAQSLLELPVQYQLNLMGYASAAFDYPDLVQGNMGTSLPKENAEKFLDELSEAEKEQIIARPYQDSDGNDRVNLFVLESDPAVLEMGRYVAYTYGIAFTFDRSAYPITSGESASTEEHLKYLNEALGWNALVHADLSAEALEGTDLSEGQKVVQSTVGQLDLLPGESDQVARSQLVLPAYAVPNAMFSTAMLRGLTLEIKLSPSYAVIYQGNGGLTEDGSETVADGYRAAGTQYTVRENMFQRDGYRFTGWEQITAYPDVDTEEGAVNTQPAGNVILEAQWSRESILPILPDIPDADLPGLLNLEDHYAYIIGYDDGKVKPQNNITRAEVATIFFRLLTDDARAYYWSTDSGFSDVHEGDWYNNAVSTMVQAGILNGYSDGTFRPNANITRGEFATIAARFLSNPYSTKDRFYDTEGHWAEVYINRAAEAGWIDGYPDGTFRPDQAITRAEAVTLVNAVLGRAPHEDHLLPDMITWPDNPKSAWYYEAIQEATNSHDYDWASNHAYEIWTELLENRQWSKLEKEWSDAYSAPGGEVMD